MRWLDWNYSLHDNHICADISSLWDSRFKQMSCHLKGEAASHLCSAASAQKMVWLFESPGRGAFFFFSNLLCPDLITEICHRKFYNFQKTSKDEMDIPLVGV
ncbi:hypothetical protein HY495_01515 [Candidatus Woesearchaeota archaeon]|nr:hypothetical protein [Candidatus Woesearchaeota archaeon]